MSGIVGSSHNIRGSGIVAKLGTDGQVFTSAGAGIKQTYEAAGGGDYVKIKSVTASDSASVEFVNGTSDVIFDGTYQAYKVIYTNVVLETDAKYILLYLSTDAGSNYVVPDGNYKYFSTIYGSFSEASQAYTNLGMISGYHFGNASGESASGEVTFFDPNQTAVNPLVHFTGVSIWASGAIAHHAGILRHSTNENIDAIKFLATSENIASGTFVLYGLK